jgi:Protein of unknown function (DUF3099)
MQIFTLIMTAYRGDVARRGHDGTFENRADDGEQVYLVTSARPGHSEEIAGRSRRYLISMGVRVVCLVLAIFVLSGWLRLVGVAAALVLPWIAVVMANAGPAGDRDQPTFVSADRIAIDGPATTPIAPSDGPR